MRFRWAVFAALLAATATDAATLRRGTNTEPRSLDPQVGVGNSASLILNDLFEGLVSLGMDGKPIPGAAESWSVSADGRTYTFILRPGLKWSDGTPLTADDFVYSFRRLLDPATAAAFASFLYPVENAREINAGKLPPEQLAARALDSRTIEVRLAYRAPYFPEVMTANSTAPVPRQAIEAHGRAWTEPGKLVSNGAYVLTARVPQTSIAAQRNPHYHGAANVKIDEVMYYPGEDQGAMLNRFRAGELDVALNFPVDQIPSIQREMPGTLQVGPGLAVWFLMANQTKPPFNDVRVRRALSLALDREGIVTKLLPPGSQPAYGMVPPTVSNYTMQKLPGHEQPLSQRQAEARRLLDEAGYGPSRPLAVGFKFDTVEQNRRLGTAMIAMWKAVGIAAAPDNSGALAIDRDARTENYELIRWTWFAPYDDASSFLATVETGDTTNRSTFSDMKLDELLRLSRETDNAAERRSLLQAAEKRALEEQAVIPIYFLGNRRLVSPRVIGWQENPRAINLTRYLSLKE